MKKSPSVLHVTAFDIQGGAARSAYRMLQAQLNNGMNAKMLVQSKASNNEYVFGPTNYLQAFSEKVRPYFDRARIKLYKKRTALIFSTGLDNNRGLVKRINQMNPDVVHLHWINAGTIGIEDLSKINAPLVWTLHDMWPMTGGCHYNEGCEKYLRSCDQCPQLGSTEINDLSHRIFNKKKNVFSHLPNLIIHGPSKWMTQEAGRSVMFAGRKILNIPYAIDLETFKPETPNAARTALGFSSDKKLILFGAASATSDPRKGFTLLQEALKSIREKRDDFELAIFGSDRNERHEIRGVKSHFLGFIDSPEKQQEIYSAADIMIVPSVQENLGNTIIESLSCGTPVVGFNIGGNPDMIENGLNGYLAKDVTSKSLAAVIEKALDSDLESMGACARERAKELFLPASVAEKWKNVYSEILENKYSEPKDKDRKNFATEPQSVI